MKKVSLAHTYCCYFCVKLKEKFISLEKTNEQLEKEIQQLRIEFNAQRAKMKEMYMNKEST